MTFLESPAVPRSKVKYVLVALDAVKKLGPALEAQGVRAVPSPWCGELPRPIRFHADTNCRHLGNNRFAVFGDAEGTEPLKDLGAEILRIGGETPVKYPFDAALNVLAFGRRLVCNPKTAAPELLAEFSKLRTVAVKQGYCSCSAAVINENAVLTGDMGIAAALRADGAAAEMMDCSEILLPGYSHGFIGGCCGLISPERLAFTGTAERLPGGEAALRKLLSPYGVSPVFLTDLPMFDCGGIVPVAV